MPRVEKNRPFVESRVRVYPQAEEFKTPQGKPSFVYNYQGKKADVVQKYSVIVLQQSNSGTRMHCPLLGVLIGLAWKHLPVPSEPLWTFLRPSLCCAPYISRYNLLYLRHVA
jgi:hypothetical protein